VLPAPDLKVELAHATSGRDVTLSAVTPTGGSWVDNLDLLSV